MINVKLNTNNILEDGTLPVYIQETKEYMFYSMVFSFFDPIFRSNNMIADSDFSDYILNHKYLWGNSGQSISDNATIIFFENTDDYINFNWYSDYAVVSRKQISNEENILDYVKVKFGSQNYTPFTPKNFKFTINFSKLLSNLPFVYSKLVIGIFFIKYILTEDTKYEILDLTNGLSFATYSSEIESKYISFNITTSTKDFYLPSQVIHYTMSLESNNYPISKYSQTLVLYEENLKNFNINNEEILSELTLLNISYEIFHISLEFSIELFLEKFVDFIVEKEVLVIDDGEQHGNIVDILDTTPINWLDTAVNQNDLVISTNSQVKKLILYQDDYTIPIQISEELFNSDSEFKLLFVGDAYCNYLEDTIEFISVNLNSISTYFYLPIHIDSKDYFLVNIAGQSGILDRAFESFNSGDGQSKNIYKVFMKIPSKSLISNILTIDEKNKRVIIFLDNNVYVVNYNNNFKNIINYYLK